MTLQYNGGLTEKSRDISISLFVELGFSRKNIRAALEETEKHLANPNLNITSHINSAKTKLTTNNKIALVEALFKISSQNGIYRAEMELLDQIMNSFKISAKKRAELIKKHQKYFVGFQWGEAGTEEKKEQKREQKRHKREASGNGLLQNVSEAFALLGLKPGTDFYEVKRTYRRLAMKNHPDKFANAPEAERHAANIRMKELNKAFATIEKHAKRLNASFGFIWNF
jgi:DnaJ-domain-containing protein 1